MDAVIFLKKCWVTYYLWQVALYYFSLNYFISIMLHFIIHWHLCVNHSIPMCKRFFSFCYFSSSFSFSSTLSSFSPLSTSSVLPSCCIDIRLYRFQPMSECFYTYSTQVLWWPGIIFRKSGWMYILNTIDTRQ